MEFDLYKALSEYKPEDNTEKESVQKTLEFLNTNSNCFSRTNKKGHITGSALVIDGMGNVLLNHHKLFDIWLQFGGHSDDDPNTLNVAKREVFEESGISDIDDLGGKIFDVDVHLIPANKSKDKNEHYHYDIRFLFIAKNKDFKISDESKCIKWLSYDEAKLLVSEPSMIRMIDKAAALF